MSWKAARSGPVLTRLTTKPAAASCVRSRYRARSGGDRFYVYKKDGTLRRTGDVWAGYRWYADTYEECVEAYNRLVNKRKEILLTKLAETEMDFIKEKNNKDSDLSGNLSENL